MVIAVVVLSGNIFIKKRSEIIRWTMMKKWSNDMEFESDEGKHIIQLDINFQV